MRHVNRYQSDPCTDEALRKWMFRLLYDYCKGVVDEEQVGHRFNFLMGRRDKAMKPQIVRRLKANMRQTIEAMKVLSTVIEQ